MTQVQPRYEGGSTMFVCGRRSSYSMAEVIAAGNEPEVAFGPETMFRVGAVPIQHSLLTPLREYSSVEQAYILELSKAFREQPHTIPNVVANKDGWVEDGAHRMLAASLAGMGMILAYIEVEDPSS